MRWNVVARLVAVAGLVFTLLAGASVGPATAQTGYPPGPCVVTVGTQTAGTLAIGQHLVLRVTPTCAFRPGAPVLVTVNGVVIPGKTVNAQGFVLIDITVLSATQISIDDPVLTPTICGKNTVVASAPSDAAGGATVTQTATFIVDCSSALARTGINVKRWLASGVGLVALGFVTVALALQRRRRPSF
jgi:hypothetical protein